MSLLQIRNVPDESRRVLKARAAARGESLNGYLLELIDREVADRRSARSSTAPPGGPNALGPRRLTRSRRSARQRGSTTTSATPSPRR